MLTKPDWVKLFENCSDFYVEREDFENDYFEEFFVFKEVHGEILGLEPNKEYTVYKVIVGIPHGVYVVENGYRKEIRLNNLENETISLGDYLKYLWEAFETVKQYVISKKIWNPVYFREIIGISAVLAEDLKKYRYYREYEIAIDTAINFLKEEGIDKWFKGGDVGHFILSLYLNTGLQPKESQIKALQERLNRLFKSVWYEIFYSNITVEPDLGGDLEVLEKVDWLYRKAGDDKRIKKAILKAFRKVISASLDRGEDVYDLEVVSDALLEVM